MTRRIKDVFEGMEHLPDKILKTPCRECGQPRGEHSGGRPYFVGMVYDRALDGEWCPDGDGFSTTTRYIPVTL